MLLHVVLIYIIIDFLGHLFILLLIEALSTLGHIEWHTLVLAQFVGVTNDSAGVQVSIVLWNVLTSRH